MKTCYSHNFLRALVGNKYVLKKGFHSFLASIAADKWTKMLDY